MSAKAKRRSIRAMWAILLVAISILVFLDITNTVAQKQNRIVNPVLIEPDPLSELAPKQNSIVGVCNSMDASLGGLQAPVNVALTYAQVDSITRLAVKRAGGLKDVIQPGNWVVIKPNILNVPGVQGNYTWSHVGSETDLRVVKSLIQQLIEEGDASRITVAEGGTWKKLGQAGTPPEQTQDGWTYHWSWYDNLSYEDMIAQFAAANPTKTIDYIDLNYPPYTADVLVPGGGLSQDSYTIPNAILHCDKLIGVAVMKTHNQARVTLVNKLYVGTSPASVYNASYWNHMGIPHYTVNGVPDAIQRTISDLVSYHPADFGIVECFYGTEGEGPIGGSTIQRNLVLASKDPVAVDAASAYAMGFNPYDIDYLHWCHNKGFGINDMDYITINGTPLDNVRYNFAKSSASQGRGIRRWLVNGTYGGTDINQDYLGGRERTISPIQGDTIGGKTWTVLTDIYDYMDLAKYYSNPSGCVVYAFTRVYTDSAMTVRLRFGSDDGIKIWLNGDSIYANASTGSWSLVQQDRPIALVKGVNRLLVKIKNTSGAYGFSMFVSEPDGDTPLGVKYSLLSPGAPEITLNSPVSGASTTNPYMDLSASVSDPDGDSMTVLIYGDDTTTASDLLYAQKKVASGSTIGCTWKARVLGVDTSTIGLWHFDEGTGNILHDASGHGHDGTWHCDSTLRVMWQTDSPFGYSLNFSGFRTPTPDNPCAADYVEVPDDPSLDVDPQGRITMEFWVKPDVLPTTRYWGIVTKRVPCVPPQDTLVSCGSPANYCIFFNYPTQTIGFYGNTTLNVSTCSLTVGVWQYIAVTVNGATGDLRFYINGILKTAMTGYIGNLVDGPIRIGSSAYRAKGVDGLLDEVRISRRVLSAEEIANNYKLTTDRYYWKVAASDGVNTTTSDTRYFDVGSQAGDTLKPHITLNRPPNDSTTANSSMQLSATVSDADSMIVSFYGGTTSAASDFLEVLSKVVNGTYTYTWNAQVLQPEPSNTMGLWHFNENSGATVNDASSNGNNGAFAGTPVWTPDGRFGYALDFNGTSDYITVPDAASLDVDSLTGALTIEAWLNPDTSGSNVWRSIISKKAISGGAAVNYQISLDRVTGNLLFYCGHYPQIFISSVYVPLHQWSYVAVTLSATEGRLRFYRNGALLDSSITGACFGPANTTVLTIGTAGVTAECFDGLIDEVRLTKRVLSTAEIADNYRLGTGRYYWKVLASDGVNDSTSEARYFNIGTPALDTLPPQITLKSPPDDSTTTSNHMQLSATITDQTPPMKVWFYGDTTASAADLLYVRENVSGSDINYDWSAPVLEPESPNTMGLWHFNENSGTTVGDESGNGNTGTFVGAPAWTADGRFGYALNFNGTSDYITIPDAASLDIDSAAGALTMEAWVYPHSSGGGTWRTIISKRASTGACNYEMTLHMTSGNLLFYSGHWPQVFISSIHVPLNQWSYLAITVDGIGRDARFYLNGIQGDAIMDTVYLGGANTGAVTLGSNGNPTQLQCFDGIIDEVRLTNRILSSEEIANNYKLKNNAYYWKVRAEDALAQDTISATRHFHVAPAPPDTVPPQITLKSPPDDSTTTGNHMQLSATVTDQTPPMKVWFYGDTTASAADLLYVRENVSGSDINYDWSAPVLEPQSPNTMGLWHFNENGGTTVGDESGNGNTGTFVGAPAWTADGRFGYALNFNGTSDYITIPDAASLDIDSAAGALTMEAWVYPDTVAGNVWRTIMSKKVGTGAPVNYQMNLDRTTGNLTFYSGHWPGIYISSVYVPPRQWSYVAITLSATEGRLRFYRNGIQGDSANGACFGPANSAPLYIGVSATLTSEIWDGKIDEVRLTKRVLSSAEIADNYRLKTNTYYWKVRAQDALAYTSTSEIRHFHAGTQVPAPSIPTLISPLNLALSNDNTPTFVWSSTAGGGGGGGSYTLEYALNSIFTSGLRTMAGIVETTYTVPDPQALTDTTYYWHVQAHNAGGFSGYQATPFSFTVDTKSPGVPTNFVVLPGYQKCKLSWTNPTGSDFRGVEVRRNPWCVGAYPEYDDTCAALGYPATPTQGDSVYRGSGTSFKDSSGTLPRNVYYYTIFSYDSAGNYSTPTTAQQGRATNYWLGDVSGDGEVYYEDLGILSNAFWTSRGDLHYNAEFDIGPTYDMSPKGIPSTDNLISFEDLVIFAINFAAVGPNQKAVPVLAGQDITGPLGLSLVMPEGGLEAGREFKLQVVLNNNPGTVKAIHFVLPYDPAQLEFTGVDQSAELKGASYPVFFDGRTRDNQVDVSLALLGGNTAIGGSGQIASISFRLLQSKDLSLGFSQIDLRDGENNKLSGQQLGTAYASVLQVPKTYGLSQNYPNPYNLQTQIAYQLPQAGMVLLKIYNIRGELVRTLVKEHKPAGYYTVTWDGKNGDGVAVSSGIYFYRLSSESFSATRKMVMIK